jgi:hypothetical protein
MLLTVYNSYKLKLFKECPAGARYHLKQILSFATMVMPPLF